MSREQLVSMVEGVISTMQNEQSRWFQGYYYGQVFAYCKVGMSLGLISCDEAKGFTARAEECVK